MGLGAWLNQSVGKLVRHGHAISEIGEYNLDQFVMFLDAAEQIEASERMGFVTDISTAIGQLFSKDPIVKKHLDLLQAIVNGERDGNSG